MKPHKQWRVVLSAEAAPAAGDWVAINGMAPGAEENVYFTFLDGRREKGFTCLEGAHALGQVPSLEELEAGHASGQIPWLHFPDCMEITGVQRLNWCPENWPDKTTLWQLTVESLSSNIEFEKRYLAETDRQYRAETWLVRVKGWWEKSRAPQPQRRYVATKQGMDFPMIVGPNGEGMWEVWGQEAQERRRSQHRT